MLYIAAVLCIAEILTMTGVATYAALLPVLRAEWTATNTLAGASAARSSPVTWPRCRSSSA